jgi:hypothetical protein
LHNIRKRLEEYKGLEQIGSCLDTIKQVSDRVLFTGERKKGNENECKKEEQQRIAQHQQEKEQIYDIMCIDVIHANDARVHYFF